MRPTAVVCGYGGFGRIGLEALTRHGAAVQHVFTHADSANEVIWWESLTEAAREQNIPYTLDADFVAGGAADARLKELAPDFIFSFYFRHMIPSRVLAHATRGSYNLHGSLLPKFRGRAPINWQLVQGEVHSGLTLHAMVKSADAGDIVHQEAIDIGPNEDAFSLTVRLMDLAPAFLDRCLPALLDGTAVHQPQDHAAATLFGRRTPADGVIPWQDSAQRVHNLVRAVAPPWPGAFTFCGPRRVVVQRTRIRESIGVSATAGTVLPGVAGACRSVACGTHVIDLLAFTDDLGAPIVLPIGAVLTPAATASASSSGTESSCVS